MSPDFTLDVLHWLPVRQRIQHRVVSLVWRCQRGLAPTYLIDLCRPVSGARGRRSLLSAERGFCWSRLPVQRLCRNRAFSVAGPRVLNDLPQELRLFPILCTDTFLDYVKV